MRIGQLAQIAGIDTQTIRFYEQQGLLPPPERQENGYRVYTVNRPRFSRHFPGSVNVAFQTLPVTAG
ncbi:MerR family DNA-binding transcriptional regulator, partial [Halopseudomonas aestusnigri]|uniref:MerR family DNA-binding transcriptional regulator n=1 Tax=Halopseudomonas aestusnigri TaxID=857252 RepID=UPI0030C6806F